MNAPINAGAPDTRTTEPGTGSPGGTSTDTSGAGDAHKLDAALHLSVIIIVKNEARHIEACLDSVAFADEWVVVDSCSTDDTVERAERWGARVVSYPDWPGFGPQKNRALDLARGEWVLSIDADERVTPELAAEIRAVLAAPQLDAYDIPRLSWFCGKPIRHSGWWPDYVLRLFRRRSGRFTDAAVHERVLVPGEVGQLKAHFEHAAYDTLDALLVKINRYSTDAALAMHQRGKRTGVAGVLGHAFWTFIRLYIIRRGFLDGRHGLVLAVAASAGSFFRYAKLMFLNARKP